MVRPESPHPRGLGGERSNAAMLFRWRKRREGGGLDALIPADIKDDPFYDLIVDLAAHESLTHVLEIGSSSGGGSTEALVRGLRMNPNRPTLHCLEISRTRFTELVHRYREDHHVRCYNASSVPPQGFLLPEEVTRFYRDVPTNLNRYPLSQVLEWLRQDLDYVRDSGVPSEGIRIIKRENGIERFDMVLIDGSAFTGAAEFSEIYGAGIILLDDVDDIKNHGNFQRLLADPSYRLLKADHTVRNGYAVFQRSDAEERAL